MAAQSSYFRSFQHPAQEGEFDAEEFLLAVESNFQSAEVHDEVRWRLQVLRELSADPDLAEAGRGLRKALSRIFATQTDEQTILGELRGLTEVEGGHGGKPVDLRSFVKRERRSYDPEAYRKVLLRKIENTRSQVQNLILFFPESKAALAALAKEMQTLASRIDLGAGTIGEVREEEARLRESEPFQSYEKLKHDFLRQWLGRFAGMTESELEALNIDDAQRLIVEHQRHQMTQLLKTEIKLSELDMSEHLDAHETLEGDFRDEAFWERSNSAARNGFREWVISAVQAFGMLKGQRYCLFENKADPDQLLLLGIGVGQFPEDEVVDEELVHMVPFVKPFTRKSGYLLEIRSRELGNAEEYHAELRHYVLPFLFAFDQMRDFDINGELLTFFTSNY